MLFDGVSAHELSDDQIRWLVGEHVCERRQLEFKVTVDHREDEDRLEALRDITSLANGGGGYLFVGIRDDGRGRAQRFEPQLVGNTTRISQSIRSLCLDHIRERIEGLEVVERIVDANPVVVVHVPPSDRRPHMVTFQERTDFWTRHQDGKRAMTMGEVRDFFTRDLFGRRLEEIAGSIRRQDEHRARTSEAAQALERVRAGAVPVVSQMDDAEAVLAVTDRAFRDSAGDRRFHRLAIAPIQPEPGLVQQHADAVLQVLKRPPLARDSGWSMYNPGGVHRSPDGFAWGDHDGRRLALHNSGVLEFSTPIDLLFCWRQSQEEFESSPRLYPYAVVEFPLTFLHLYRAVASVLGLARDAHFVFQYININGVLLRPHRPEAVGYMTGLRQRRFNSRDLTLSRRLAPEYDADASCHATLVDFYAAFGLEPGDVPFYRPEAGEFERFT